MSYRKLQILILAREIVIDVHDMTMNYQSLNCTKKVRKSGGRAKQQKLPLLTAMVGEGTNRIG